MKTARLHIYHSGLRSECLLQIGESWTAVANQHVTDMIAELTWKGYNIELLEHHNYKKQIPDATSTYTPDEI